MTPIDKKQLTDWLKRQIGEERAWASMTHDGSFVVERILKQVEEGVFDIGGGGTIRRELKFIPKEYDGEFPYMEISGILEFPSGSNIAMRQALWLQSSMLENMGALYVSWDGK